LVNEKHKLVFCQTPKVGSTSWCRIMLNRFAMRERNMYPFPLSKQKDILANYTKFMFVRHPFTRLLSAFNGKMKKKDGKYQRGIEKYVNKIKDHYKWDRNATEDVEFVDFINMVVSNVDNVHWSEMYKVCGSCDIHYDVIEHFEDMTNDAKYILKISNVTSVGFPEPSKSHVTYSSVNDKIFKVFTGFNVS
ncbi:carbohydrate sulfotransferase 11-like, partial [Antedon mediterranea]|uniref:carbohydrate sulfotransferase 11-like n=1 Tax=Antedon mediterranea TaxID=105859 RepID=UPI003AF898BE